nr:SDR family oxidoreductase [Mesorhizobium sp.]
MKRLGGGSIINFGSVSTRIGSNLPAYMTAKAGAHGLTKGLARDLGPFNIRVNTLVPGWVMTERQRREHLTPEGEVRIDALQAFPRASSPTISRRWHCFWLLMTARCVHRRNLSWTAVGSRIGNNELHRSRLSREQLVPQLRASASEPASREALAHLSRRPCRRDS